MDITSLSGLDQQIEDQISNIPDPTGETSPPPQQENPQEVEPNLIKTKEVNEGDLSPESHDLKDSQGLTFDPRIHEKNKDGSPRNWQGKLKRKNGWKKAWAEIEKEKEIDEKENFQTTEPEPIPDDLKEQPPEDQPELQDIPGVSSQDLNSENMVPINPQLMDISNRYIAELITDSYINIGIMKFGDEWHPIAISKEGKTDRDDIVIAWEKYLDEKRAGQNIPAWLAPFLTMASYAVTRITTKKKTQEGFFNFVGKARGWVYLRYVWLKQRFFSGKSKATQPPKDKEEGK